MLLTDEEIWSVQKENYTELGDNFDLARAIEAKIMEKIGKPVAVTIDLPISDPCGDEQLWLIRVHSALPLDEGTLLYKLPEVKE